VQAADTDTDTDSDSDTRGPDTDAVKTRGELRLLQKYLIVNGIDYSVFSS